MGTGLQVSDSGVKQRNQRDEQEGGERLRNNTPRVLCERTMTNVLFLVSDSFGTS